MNTEKKQIKTQVHTIIMLIGPSGSGKTTFAKKILIPQLRCIDGKNNTNMTKMNELYNETSYMNNIQYINSDEIRRDILGNNYNKNDEIMTESSSQAFDILFTKLRAVTSYPINSEFVILDTTGLSETFRNNVIEIAKENNYNLDAIVFNYKNVEEYKKEFNNSKFIGEKAKNGKVINQHLKRLKKDTLKTLKKDIYKNITQIKDKNFIYENIINEDLVSLKSNYVINVTNFDKYVKNILPNKFEWVNIGDIHGCIKELKELISKFSFVIDKNNFITDSIKSKNIGIILAGDLIDKGSHKMIEETIRFIYKNMNMENNRFQIIMGNHEEFVYNWITNPEFRINKKDIKDNSYNTISLLEDNKELKNMFIEIFENMKIWVKSIGTNKRTFITTHAPCETKYLEKMDETSSFKMILSESRSKNKDKTLDKLYSYLKEEAVNNHPLHIFGHLNQKNVRSFKNKICIDTSCIYGSKLSGITINYGRWFIQTVNSYQEVKENNNLPLFSFSIKNNNIDFNSLNENNQKRLNYIMKNGIEYIGGTISPTPKDKESGDFENLKSGIDYYKNKIDKVILEPKYMGSRSQMYLNVDIEKCYATSRNGYKIRIDLKELFKKELVKYQQIMNDNDLIEITLDGELMPWTVLGKGLIDSHFGVVDKALESELNFLKENNFDENFENLKNEYEKSDFKVDKNNMNKKDLSNKYKHLYYTFKEFQEEDNRFVKIDKHIEAYKIYNEQIKIYGSESEIDYKAFRILKGIKSDGTIWNVNMSNSKQFSMINNDDYFIVDLNDKDSYEKAQKWFDELTIDKKMEGCIIKPEGEDIKEWVLPFMKVRNKNYLSIIYGYDMYFPKKYEGLFNNKKVDRKIKASLNEYKLGEQMLQFEKGSVGLKQAMANFMFENEKVKGIDPRL